MTRVAWPLLLSTALLLVHCGPNLQVNSLPRSGWSKPIDRVFLHCVANPSGSNYSATDMQERLARLLASHQVTTHTWASNLLDLADADKLKAEVASFKPHYLLWITQTSATSMNGWSRAATFDLKLTELGSEEPIWRARTAMASTWGGDAEALALAILQAMHRDGILPS